MPCHADYGHASLQRATAHPCAPGSGAAVVGSRTVIGHHPACASFGFSIPAPLVASQLPAHLDCLPSVFLVLFPFQTDLHTPVSPCSSTYTICCLPTVPLRRQSNAILPASPLTSPSYLRTTSPTDAGCCTARDRPPRTLPCSPAPSLPVPGTRTRASLDRKCLRPVFPRARRLAVHSTRLLSACPWSCITSTLHLGLHFSSCPEWAPLRALLARLFVASFGEA
jgi:hypothetical protein